MKLTEQEKNEIFEAICDSHCIDCPFEGQDCVYCHTCPYELTINNNNTIIMSKPTKYDRVRSEFTITKGKESGRYNFAAKYCKYLNYTNGTPEEIADHIAVHIAETIRGMPINNAREIKMNMSWK